LGNEEQIVELRKQDLKELEPGIDENEADRIARDWVREKLIRDPYFLDEQSYTETKENDIYGVFSLTEKSDDILMWSHYSNKHRGFCVGFDVIALLNFFGGLLEKGPDWYITPCSIKYTLDYPILNPFKMEGFETIIKSLTLKSREWAYEREYRFLMMVEADTSLKDTDRLINLPEGIITKVILGCMISKEDKEEIIGIIETRKNKIELLQARKAFGKFALEFDRV
jgi:hypothetical protein